MIQKQETKTEKEERDKRGSLLGRPVKTKHRTTDLVALIDSEIATLSSYPGAMRCYAL